MIIAIVNQKGGTGKTTTTINLGSALSAQNYNVLLLDMDPQSNLSYSLGINDFDYSIQDVLTKNVAIQDAIIQKEQMDVLPTSTGLAKLELGQIDISQTAYFLKEAIKEIKNEYDFILIDCPPSLSWLTINALVAAHRVLVPMQLDVFSIQGLSQIIDTISELKSEYNEKLKIIGVLAVLVDTRKKLTHEVINYVQKSFEVHLFENVVRTNVKAAEAPSFGKSVINYAPNSNSANDYTAFTQELLERIKEKQLHTKIY